MYENLKLRTWINGVPHETFVNENKILLIREDEETAFKFEKYKIEKIMRIHIEG